MVAFTLSIIVFIPNVPKAHASPAAALSIKPSIVPLATGGSTVTLQVNVTNVTPVSGVDIYVSLGTTAQSVLNPTTITLGTAILSPFEITHCINNVGTGCDANDGPGIVHDAFASLVGGSAAGNFTLFTISYTAVAGPGTSVFFEGVSGNPESVTINNGLNSLFDPSGFNITGVSEVSGTYGNPLPPNFSVSASTVSPANILATNSGVSTITVSSLNNFAGTVSLAANPSSGLSCNTLAPVTLTTGSTATSTLTCSAATGADYAASVTGTGGSPSQSITSNSVTFHVVDFSVSCNPASLTVVVGTSQTCVLSVSPINGFNLNLTPVSFSTSAVPSGCTVSISGTALTVSCASVPSPASFTLTITATAGTAPTSPSRTTTVSVTVVPPAAYTITLGAVTPTSILATNSGASTITVTSQGFAGTVTLASNPSSGLSCNTPASVILTAGSTATSTLRCNAAVGGDYSASVTGTGGSPAQSITSNSTKFHVVDFAPSCPPITSVPGASNCTFVPINGFSGIVTWAVSTGFTFPTGCSGSFTGNVLSVNCATGVTTFSVPVTATTGTAPDLLSRSTSVSVFHVDFTIAGPPITTLATVAGSSTMVVTPINGFSGTVIFTVSSGFTFPTGCNGSFTGAVLSVTCAAGVAPFIVPVTGTSSGSSGTASVSVTVQDFSLSAPGFSLSASGVAGTSQIVVTAINGFTGTINYAVTNGASLPVGCTAAVSTAGLISVTCSPLPATTFVVTVRGTAASAASLFRDVNGAAGVALFLAPPLTVSLGSVSPLSVLATQSGSSTITLNSVGTFAGTVTLTANPSAGLTCFPLGPVNLVAGGTTTSTLTCSAPIGGDYTATVTATGGSPTQTVVSNRVTFHVVDFSVSCEPIVTIATVAGTSSCFVVPINGFTGAFTITIKSTLPAACVVSFTGNVLSVDCVIGVTPFDIIVCVTSDGLTRCTTLHVIVQDFSIAGPAITTLATVAGTSTIAVSPINGFTGVATFAFGSGFTFPTGCIGSFTGAVSSVTCATGVALFDVIVCGTSDGLTRCMTLHVTVQDFALSAHPATLTVIAGGANSSMISVMSINGFTGAVAFSARGATASCVVTMNSINGVLIVSCPLTQTAATFDVIVTGTTALGVVPGVLARTVSVPVTVVSKSLNLIFATPSLVYLESGDSGTSTISVISLGTFTGTVCLTASGADVLSPFLTPACVKISTPQTSASATLSFASIEGQTPSGTYRITVTATSESTSASTTVTVVVLSNAIKMKVSTLNQVSIGSGGLETWTASLRNRSGTTQYAIVTILAISSSGTRPFIVQSAIVTTPAGETVALTVTHTFTSADIGLQFRWTAMVQFGSSASNLNQIGVPFRSGSFVVTS